MTQPSVHQAPSSEPLSPESSEPLGKLEQEFHLSPRETMKVWMVSPVLVLAGLGFLTLPIWIPGTGDFLGILGPVGLGAIVGSIWHMQRWYRARDMSLRLHEHGLSYRRNGATQVYRWEQAVQVRHFIWEHQVENIHAGTSTKVFLTMGDGVTLTFTEQLERIQAVARYLDEKLFALRLPHVREALRNGESVSFGPVSVSSEGLVYEGEALPWREFESAAGEEGGSIVIRKAGKFLAWANVGYSAVPNPNLFLTVVYRLSRGEPL